MRVGPGGSRAAAAHLLRHPGRRGQDHQSLRLLRRWSPRV